MNWRIIAGLAFLLLGVKVFATTYYTTGPSGAHPDGFYSHIIGSLVWIGVGIFLMVRGMSKKDVL